MEKNWVIKQQGDEKKVKHLQDVLNIHYSLANLLVQKGITSFDSAKEFFRPDLNNLHDPFLMKDMQKAIDRLKVARESQESLLIYGDYDVDGTTSVSLLKNISQPSIMIFLIGIMKDMEFLKRVLIMLLKMASL